MRRHVGQRMANKDNRFQEKASLSGSRLDNIRSQIRYEDPQSLVSRPDNPRTHSAQQIRKICASITRFGFLAPVLADRNSRVIAGNARLEAARQLNLRSIPVVCIEHLSPREIKAFAIAENRTAELAGWDKKLLAIDLMELSLEDSIDITVTGFDTAEVDLIIGGTSLPDPLDETPEIDRASPPLACQGDLFQIGRHRLLCADALCSSSYVALLGGNKAQMCFTDPPYNVPVAGHVSGLGKIQHREFVQASGELSQSQFTDFLSVTAARISESCKDGAIIFTCMDWRHSFELLSACVPSRGLTYRNGAPRSAYEYSGSKALFADFLATEAPFSVQFDQSLAVDFYVNVRCGLLHEARTKGGWTILAGDVGGRFVDPHGKVVFRNNLQLAITSFTDDLRNKVSSDIAYRQAFVRKMEGLCLE
jgi:hypothetical protein